MATRTERSRRKFRPKLAATLIALPAFVVLLGLGYWQVERLEWKRGLIAAIDERGHLPPVDLPAEIDQPADWSFRPVRVSGRYAHDQAQHLMARVRDGQLGIELLTPLVRENAPPVLVDRGWVPADPSGDVAPYDEPQGDVVIQGFARVPETVSSFTPDNRPADREWFSVDLAALSKQTGYALAPVYVMAMPLEGTNGSAAGTYPAPMGRLPELPNNHLQYAITWFALAGALLGVYVLAHFRRDSGES